MRDKTGPPNCCICGNQSQLLVADILICQLTGLPSGAVYPAMRRLERDGLVQSHWGLPCSLCSRVLGMAVHMGWRIVIEHCPMVSFFDRLPAIRAILNRS
jgi:hypothetical protein